MYLGEIVETGPTGALRGAPSIPTPRRCWPRSRSPISVGARKARTLVEGDPPNPIAALGLPVPPPLPLCHGPVPQRGTRAARHRRRAQGGLPFHRRLSRCTASSPTTPAAPMPRSAGSTSTARPRRDGQPRPRTRRPPNRQEDPMRHYKTLGALRCLGARHQPGPGAGPAHRPAGRPRHPRPRPVADLRRPDRLCLALRQAGGHHARSGNHPALATGWEWSDDGTDADHDAARGVVFHDGTPFNAEAVAANIDRSARTCPKPRAASPSWLDHRWEVVDDVHHQDHPRRARTRR
jgi:hypothetical protein